MAVTARTKVRAPFVVLALFGFMTMSGSSAAMLGIPVNVKVLSTSGTFEQSATRNKGDDVLVLIEFQNAVESDVDIRYTALSGDLDNALFNRPLRIRHNKYKNYTFELKTNAGATGTVKVQIEASSVGVDSTKATLTLQ